MATISEIQTCINNLTTGSEAAEFAILATQAARETSNNLSFSVATVAALPDLLTTNTPNGQIVFVVSLAIPVIASKLMFEWRGMDGRLIRKDGVSSQLWTWGLNTSGQIGDGSLTNRSSPGTTAGGGTNWCRISTGNTHTAGVKTDGTLWTWGCNATGQLGDGTAISRISPGTICGGGSTWCQIGAGTCHNVAVKTDGTLWTWGGNGYGQLGISSTVNRSSPGTTAGPNYFTWCQASSGRSHTAAVKTDGTLWTWGYGLIGQLGAGTATNRSSPGQTCGTGSTWCQVAAGLIHTTAVKNDGTLWIWGTGACGVIGDNTATTKSSPVSISGGGTTWCQVSAGSNISSAVKQDGTLWTWGANNTGQMGTLNTTSRSSPGTTSGGGTTWCQISSGSSHNAATKTDGIVWTWGYSGNGRLGDNTTANKSSPVTIAGGRTSWCTASAGGSHTAAISAC
jgi:alpha-tubulin suppressor-like RCC1 family protein